MTGAAKGAQNPGLFPPSVAAGLLPPWLKNNWRQCYNVMQLRRTSKVATPSLKRERNRDKTVRQSGVTPARKVYSGSHLP